MLSHEEAVDMVRDNGHQVTPQRDYLIDLCLSSDGHFTADDLSDLDEQRQDQLSRATIYNTLHLLVDIGILRELNDMGSSCYYEVKDHVHPHARCKACNQLMDIPVDLQEEVDSWNLPFEVEGIRMTVEGLCQACADTAQPASA